MKLVTFLLFLVMTANAANKPNIIYIMCDDMGMVN